MPDYLPATTYEFDDDGVQARLDVTTISGKPAATASVDGQDASRVRVRLGTSRHTVEGLLSDTADGDRVTVSMIVPVVQLASRAVQAKAVVIVTTAKSSIGGPALIKGPLEVLDTREITGKARIVKP